MNQRTVLPIVVVDDEPIILRILSLALDPLEWTVHLDGTQLRGLEAVLQQPADQRGVGNGSKLVASQGLVAQRLTITVVEFVVQVKRIVDAKPAAFTAFVQQFDAPRSTAPRRLRVRSQRPRRAA